MSDADILSPRLPPHPPWQARQNSANAPLLQAVFICLLTQYQNILNSFVATESRGVGSATGCKNQGTNRDLRMFIICTGKDS